MLSLLLNVLLPGCTYSLNLCYVSKDLGFVRERREPNLQLCWWDTLQVMIQP